MHAREDLVLGAEFHPIAPIARQAARRAGPVAPAVALLPRFSAIGAEEYACRRNADPEPALAIGEDGMECEAGSTGLPRLCAGNFVEGGQFLPCRAAVAAFIECGGFGACKQAVAVVQRSVVTSRAPAIVAAVVWIVTTILSLIW